MKLFGDLPWIYPRKIDEKRYLGKDPLVFLLIFSIINGGAIHLCLVST